MVSFFLFSLALPVAVRALCYLIDWVRQFESLPYRGQLGGPYSPPVVEDLPTLSVDELAWDETEPEEVPKPARYRKWPGR